jgi:hypothetical protein
MTEIWRRCALGILEILLVGKVQVLLHGSIVLFVAWVAGLVCVGFDTCANAAEALRGKDCNENEFHWMAFPMVN